MCCKHVTVQGSVMLLHLSLARLGCSLPCLTCKPLAAVSGPAFKASVDVHSLPDCLLLVINLLPCMSSILIFPNVNILPPCATVSMPKDAFSYISTTPQITVPLAIPATSMAAETLTCSLALRASPSHSPACISTPANTCRRNSFPGCFSVWTPQPLDPPLPPPNSTSLLNKWHLSFPLSLPSVSLWNLIYISLCFSKHLTSGSSPSPAAVIKALEEKIQ